MKSKISALFQWILAFALIGAVIWMNYVALKFFYETGRVNAVATELIDACTANGGELELVQWKYGCARGERQVNCQVLECIGK